MPFQLEPYRSPNTTTIANLIGGADEARAEGIRRSGAAIAQGVESVGNLAGATANNLVRLKLDEPRRQLEQLQLSEAQRAHQDDLDARDAFTQAQGDPDKAVALLEQKGNYHVSMKLRSELNQQRLRDIETQGHLLDNTEKRLGQVTQLMQAVETDPDPPTAYKRVVTAARQYAGPQLAATIPDEYDPSTVAQLKTWGMKSVDYARTRRDAATTAAEGLRSAVTRIELNDKMTTALAQYAQTIDNQDEWTNARQEMVHISGDVASDVLKKFPEVWTPDLKTQAQKYLAPNGFAKTETVSYTGDDGKTHITEAAWNKTSNEWFAAGDATTPLANVRKFDKDPATGRIDVPALTQAVLEHPEAFNDLTDTAKTQLWPGLAKAGFQRPDRPDRGASVASAERWKQRAMSDLDKERRDEARMPRQMTDEEYKAKAAAIEQSYQLQVGKPTAARLTPPPTNGVGNQSTPTAGAPKPITAPPAVQQTLKGQRPGHYKLTDGSVWTLNADGTITPGR
jgi:hypothetical protein